MGWGWDMGSGQGRVGGGRGSGRVHACTILGTYVCVLARTRKAGRRCQRFGWLLTRFVDCVGCLVWCVSVRPPGYASYRLPRGLSSDRRERTHTTTVHSMVCVLSRLSLLRPRQPVAGVGKM